MMREWQQNIRSHAKINVLQIKNSSSIHLHQFSRSFQVVCLLLLDLDAVLASAFPGEGGGKNQKEKNVTPNPKFQPCFTYCVFLVVL